MEDLEEDASPEELMLSYVSGEKNKVRGVAGSNGHLSMGWGCAGLFLGVGVLYASAARVREVWARTWGGVRRGGD